jgi:hypothetical protein
MGKLDEFNEIAKGKWNVGFDLANPLNDALESRLVPAFAHMSVRILEDKILEAYATSNPLAGLRSLQMLYYNKLLALVSIFDYAFGFEEEVYNQIVSQNYEGFKSGTLHVTGDPTPLALIDRDRCEEEMDISLDYINDIVSQIRVNEHGTNNARILKEIARQLLGPGEELDEMIAEIDAEDQEYKVGPGELFSFRAELAEIAGNLDSGNEKLADYISQVQKDNVGVYKPLISMLQRMKNEHENSDSHADRRLFYLFIRNHLFTWAKQLMESSYAGINSERDLSDSGSLKSLDDPTEILTVSVNLYNLVDAVSYIESRTCQEVLSTYAAKLQNSSQDSNTLHEFTKEHVGERILLVYDFEGLPHIEAERSDGDLWLFPYSAIKNWRGDPLFDSKQDSKLLKLGRLDERETALVKRIREGWIPWSTLGPQGGACYVTVVSILDEYLRVRDVDNISPPNS